MAGTPSKAQLLPQRVAIYKKHVKPQPRGLFVDFNGKPMHIPKGEKLRLMNFADLVNLNFYRGFNSNPWPEGKIDHLPVYKKLREYALTNFGAATIHRVLLDNKNSATPTFEIQYDDGAAGQKAQAGYNFILLSKDFPNPTPFKGGEVKHAISIIHHEFGHTRFFTGHTGKVIVTLEHERLAVIHNDNPVRMLYGLEPRYTYYRADGTINIINGTTSNTEHTFNAADPRQLVKIGSPGAYK